MSYPMMINALKRVKKFVDQSENIEAIRKMVATELMKVEKYEETLVDLISVIKEDSSKE